MTSQDAADYVNAFNGVALLAHTLWIRLRPAGSTDALVTPAARAAAAILSQLPAGAAARWEAPDGTAVTVWWVSPPAGRTGQEDFRLC
ncbi:hypothetical protein ACFYXW_12325 [Streptomyces sp. NPDC001981]|uniref:hypothetical protein n=1 Tax=Streptomyces sp. NPDC001981 TaxID=3364628 RepID=UPI0036A3A16D